MTARIPVPEDDAWCLGQMPDLGELAHPQPQRQDIVDHGFLHLDDGRWLLWGAIRHARHGHIICGWEGDCLERGPWTPTGIKLRAERQFGERVSDEGKELICAPFFLRINGRYYCYYNSEGIHLLESNDGRNYQRVLNADGHSRNHIGGRDPMVLKIGDTYFAYSCVSTVSADGWGQSFVIVRTSKEPVSMASDAWSDYTIVAAGGRAGNGPVSAESPFVVLLDGYYYLFRSSSIDFHTYVYRSEDPYNFGVNDDSRLIARYPLKAPEIVEHDGQWYISDLGDFSRLLMHRLRWEKDIGQRPGL